MKQRKVLHIKEFNMFGIENDNMPVAYSIDLVGFQAVVYMSPKKSQGKDIYL